MSNLDCMAQAKITILGAGFTIRNAPVGLNAGTVALLAIRANKSAPHITYAVSSFLTLTKIMVRLSSAVLRLIGSTLPMKPLIHFN